MSAYPICLHETHVMTQKAAFNSIAAAIALGVALGSSTVMAQAKPGNAAEGQRKAAMCIGCHGIQGYKATFPEVYSVPYISGQSGKYIESALMAYQKGERRHPTMRGIAASLSEQDMADLAAFYEGNAKHVSKAPETAATASEEVNKLIAKGACVSCHGANFSKPIDPSYPKLAGLPADYLYNSLRSYKIEGVATVGRDNAIMGGQAKQYSLAELKSIAKYIASLPGEMTTVEQPKFIQRQAAK
jgi:cytochrome c553